MSSWHVFHIPSVQKVSLLKHCVADENSSSKDARLYPLEWLSFLTGKKNKRTSLPITLPETNSKCPLKIGHPEDFIFQPYIFRGVCCFREGHDWRRENTILPSNSGFLLLLNANSCEVPMKIQVLPIRRTNHSMFMYFPVREGRNKCTTNITTIIWVWPPPSNSGKWRFIGIPY